MKINRVLQFCNHFYSQKEDFLSLCNSIQQYLRSGQVLQSKRMEFLLLSDILSNMAFCIPFLSCIDWQWFHNLQTHLDYLYQTIWSIQQSLGTEYQEHMAVEQGQEEEGKLQILIPSQSLRLVLVDQLGQNQQIQQIQLTCRPPANGQGEQASQLIIAQACVDFIINQWQISIDLQLKAIIYHLINKNNWILEIFSFQLNLYFIRQDSLKVYQLFSITFLCFSCFVDFFNLRPISQNGWTQMNLSLRYNKLNINL